MSERTLFDDDLTDAPVAHTSDPLTSHEAAEQHTKSGQRDAHCRLVLELVRKHPDKTAVELWDICNPFQRHVLVEMQEVRRRLTDLLHAGRVCQGPARACTVKGSKMVTWNVAP